MLPFETFGRPNTKSIQMDSQHPVGTGRLASGEAAYAEDLTR